LLTNDSTHNTSNIVDKSLKSTDASIIKDKKITDQRVDKPMDNSSITKKSYESLNISNEMKAPNTLPSKEIEYKMLEKDRKIDENDINQIKKSFKNLEAHLIDFWKEKSSRDVTPKKEERKLDVLPEQYPIMYNFASDDKHAQPEKAIKDSLR
jgi:hypothetical protein